MVLDESAVKDLVTEATPDSVTEPVFDPAADRMLEGSARALGLREVINETSVKTKAVFR